MIEIMCRDGKVPSKELEKVADMIYYSTGIETEVVYEEDRRALVFWGCQRDRGKFESEIDQHRRYQFL